MCELRTSACSSSHTRPRGEIPTDQGYRYYVDNMIDSTRLSKNDLRAIESIDLAHEAQARPDRLMEKGLARACPGFQRMLESLYGRRWLRIA